MAKNDQTGIDPDTKAAARKAVTGGNSKGTSKAKSAAKPRATSKRGSYSAAVVERAKLVKLIPEYSNPASPKQHDYMDKAFKKALKKAGGESQENLLSIAGLYGDGEKPFLEEGQAPSTLEQAQERLLAFAQSNREKSGSTKTMKTLVESVADEAAIRPRHVAAALLAYGWQLDGSAAQRLAEASPKEKEEAAEVEEQAEEQAAEEAGAPA